MKRFIGARRKLIGLTFASLAVVGLVGSLIIPSGIAQEPAVEDAAGVADSGTAVVITIDGPIGPAISDYVTRGITHAEEIGANLVVLKMDTPGGLDTSMRDIIKAILASRVPVVSWVAPSGARAASAGTYILYASHVAAMAPGTNIGAATPVQIGGMPEVPVPGEPEAPGDAAGTPATSHPTMEDKVINDAAAYIRSLAELRNRNVDWAETAVTRAASISAEEALEAGGIDLMAPDLQSLLSAIDGRTVEIEGREYALQTENLLVTAWEPDWRTELLAVITNPNVAYMLLMVGVYGLIMEFSNPGAIVPGVIGATCLLLALFALQLLPVSYAGLALLFLGLALIAGEAFVPSFGALGIGGIIVLVIGSIMLIDTDVPGFGVSPVLIGTLALVSGGILFFIVSMAVRAFGRPVVSGAEGMIDLPGEVISWSEGAGRVRTHGEIWQADGPEGLKEGQMIRVKDIQELRLTVEPDIEAETEKPEAGDAS